VHRRDTGEANRPEENGIDRIATSAIAPTKKIQKINRKTFSIFEGPEKGGEKEGDDLNRAEVRGIRRGVGRSREKGGQTVKRCGEREGRS